MDRLRASVQEQNVRYSLPPDENFFLPSRQIQEHPPSEQSVSNPTKRTADAMGGNETLCETVNSPVRSSHV